MSQIRVKSEFSFLKGLGKIDEYISKVKKIGEDTLFLTDDNLHGSYQFLEKVNSNGINGIIGLEIKIKEHDNNGNIIFNNIILYAKNYEGFKNLIKLETNSYKREDLLLNGNYLLRKDLEDIDKGNLKIVIPYDNGFLNKMLLNKDSLYKDFLAYYKGLFKDDIFIEEQPQKIHLENFIGRKINKNEYITLHKYLNIISEKFKIKILPSNYVLYPENTDGDIYEVFNGLGQEKNILDKTRISYLKEDHSYLDKNSMLEIFGNKKMNNINEFKKGFSNFKIPKITKFPIYIPTDFEKKLFNEFKEKYGEIIDDIEFYLRYHTYLGFFKRIEKDISKENLFLLVSRESLKKLDLKNNKYTNEEIHKISEINSIERQNYINSFDNDISNRLKKIDYELLVVDGMGFNGYFLIVEDYIKWAKNNGIPVGPGRGSAAGSLVVFCLGITDIDPLKFDLLFERFLNPSRVSMPDIDTDFNPLYIPHLINYVRQKYGKDNVANVATFGTMAARASIKDVFRYYAENYQIVDRFIKELPERPGIKISDIFNESEFLNEQYNTNGKVRKVIDIAQKLEGQKRQSGVHACAVIISPEPLTNFTALSINKKGKIVTELEAEDLEGIGLLKMDFLGLKNLSIINETLKIVKENGLNNEHYTDKNGLIDLLKINYDDKKVYDYIFSKGDTTGIFQFESDGMRKYLKKLKADKLEDIVAMVALYRPGPIAFIPSFIRRKHKEEEIKYLNPVLKPITELTYGHVIYQEQIIKMSQVYAGYSAGEADILRRAIGKKKKDIIEEQKGIFVQKAKEMNRDGNEALKIFEDIIEPAGDYSFNKSHAVCYAYIAFQTAFCKTYYEIPFYTALLNSKIEIDSDIDNLGLENNNGLDFNLEVKSDSSKKDIEDIGEIIKELYDKKINFTKPNINTNGLRFTFNKKGNYIEYGLYGIKGLPQKSIEYIISERNKNGIFKDLNDFFKRIPSEYLDKKTLETLIMSGCLDEFGDRETMLEIIDDISELKKEKYKQKELDLNKILSVNYDKQYENLVTKIKLKFESGKITKKEKELFEKIKEISNNNFINSYLEGFNNFKNLNSKDKIKFFNKNIFKEDKYKLFIFNLIKDKDKNLDEDFIKTEINRYIYYYNYNKNKDFIDNVINLGILEDFDKMKNYFWNNKIEFKLINTLISSGIIVKGSNEYENIKKYYDYYNKFKKEEYINLQKEKIKNIIKNLKHKETHITTKIQMEKKLLGYSFQENPMHSYSKYIYKYNLDFDSIQKQIIINNKIGNNEDKKPITLIGFIEDKKSFISKGGNKRFIISGIGFDFTFDIFIDHNLIQESQIVPGSIIKIDEKLLKIDENGKKHIILNNPFNFKTTYIQNFENKVFNDEVYKKGLNFKKGLK